MVKYDRDADCPNETASSGDTTDQRFMFIGFCCGGYIGASAGYGWGNADTSYEATGFSGFGSSIDANGFIGGIYGGYNHQFGNGFVLGGEADINYAHVRGDGTLISGAGVPDPSQTFESK